MNINRNNYEEYFLLYTDDELSKEGRRLVEAFVAKNLDLKEEFQLLQDMKLDPDEEVSFTDKASLYKPFTLNDDIFQPDADQQKLLMLIDNELNNKEKEELERRIQENGKLRTELEILKKTTLEPDLSIVFPDKQTLYRIEEKTVRVIRIGWIRIAAAAAILLIAGLLWLNKTEDQTGASKTIAVVKEERPDSLNKDSQIPSVLVNDSATEKGTALLNEDKITTSSVPEKTEIAKLQDRALNAEAVKRKTKNIEKNNPGANRKEPLSLAINEEPAISEKTADNITPAIQQSLAGKSPEIKTENVDVSDKQSVAAIKSDYATEALLSAQETVEVVQAEEGPARKGAMRGLFRKANRFINKVTNPDSKDGPTVKVASFEIALAR